MTRKHFEAIARTVREANVTPEARLAMALEFARTCKATNPRFDNARFLRACGVETC